MKYIVDTGTEIVDISNQFQKNYNPPTEECTHEEFDGNNRIACCLCNPQLFTPTRKEIQAYSTYIITKKLLIAKDKYYSTGDSPLSDDEYDALESSLRAINPNAPILNKVGYTVDSDE